MVNADGNNKKMIIQGLMKQIQTKKLPPWQAEGEEASAHNMPHQVMGIASMSYVLQDLDSIEVVSPEEQLWDLNTNTRVKKYQRDATRIHMMVTSFA